MRVRDDAWAWAGNLLLTATVGRGWVLLAGLLGILLITNLAAFALLIALRKSHGRGELKIKTPFLTITDRTSAPRVTRRSIQQHRNVKNR